MRTLRLPSRLALLALLGTAGVALAAEGWSAFRPAFPGLPCQDGWSGCIVDGKPMSPGMVLDDAGRPHPSDMRLGFFDFDPLPALSPFVGVSPYTGEGVKDGSKTTRTAPVAEADTQGAQADAAARAQEEAAAQAREATTRQAEEGARQAREAEAAAQREQASRHAAEEASRKAADQAEKAARDAAAKAASADASARVEAQRQADEARKAAEDARKTAATQAAAADQARKAAEAEARKRAEAEAAQRAAEESARKAAADAAAKATADAAARDAAAKEAAAKEAAAKAAAAKTTAGGDAVAMGTTPPPASPPAGPATCDDLVALEVPAMMGQLGAGVRQCLEGSLSATSTQTTKDKISRVLIADAEARRDQVAWEQLMKRHLETIDRSDPNLCFKYALHLSRGGASRATGVIRWADYALENKQQWQGAAYTKNVYGLYKIRAQAANKLWESAEAKLVEDRSDENEASSERFRGQTKDYAREWLDYAKASSQDTSAAMALCVSAAGNREFCGG